MGRHSAAGSTLTRADVATPLLEAPVPTRAPGSRKQLNTMALAMIALTLFVVAILASYAGAFAKPTLHHLEVAVVGTDEAVNTIASQDALAVNRVDDDAAARRAVHERRDDAAFVMTPTGELKIYVAGGGGHSVVSAAESVGQAVAAKAGLRPVIEDIAPTSAGNPSGTVEFYAVIFLSIGASAGAALFNQIMGRIRTPARFAWRSMTLIGYSALPAAAVTVYIDAILGADIGHPAQVFGALWLYALAVAGAITGLAAAAGTAASVVLTLFLVIVGNAAAAGPVGRPLLSGFYSTFTAIVPQGSGVSLLRSIGYFDGNGATAALSTLAAWAGIGCALAVGTVTVSVVRQRAHSQHAHR